MCWTCQMYGKSKKLYTSESRETNEDQLNIIKKQDTKINIKILLHKMICSNESNVCFLSAYLDME